MTTESLPYTVLLILAQITAGSLATLCIFNLRFQLTRGYLLTSAATILSFALLTSGTILSLEIPESISGFLINKEMENLTRLLLHGTVILSALHLLSLWKLEPMISRILGALAAISGSAAIFALAALFSPPAWSYHIVAVNLALGSLVLGGSLMAMLWGHWYLTSGKLPKEPMVAMAKFTLGALLLHALSTGIFSSLPAASPPINEISFGNLYLNANFWLRMSVGFGFPIAATWLAWRAALINGMMSTTGLLYLALGAILGGETLGRALFFTTGVTT